MLIQNQKHICVNCGKGVQYAHLVSFSKNRVNHIRRPNLHTIRVLSDGKVVRQRLCTNCIKKAVRPHKIAMAEKARLAEVIAKTPAKVRVRREAA